MADSKLSEMISSSLESIRTIADSGTVVGDPITTNNGTVIIPVSKISVGFASGGLDYLPKNGDKKDQPAQNPKMPAKTPAPEAAAQVFRWCRCASLSSAGTEMCRC